MQIFWVSSAVGQIKSINITFKKLVVIFLCLVTTLIAIGVGLQFLGFRMAIEYDPSIARKLGNLHTAVELENLQALYRLKLDELNRQIETNRQKINALTRLNKQLSEMATPSSLRKEHDKLVPSDAFNQTPMIYKKNTLGQFSSVYKDIKSLNQATQESIDNTQQYLSWLESKPIKVPLHGPVLLTSEFGQRTDPVFSEIRLHPGIDLKSSIGTPFFSSAKGRVAHVKMSPEYGNEILIDHGSGFLTRYAHVQTIAVKTGMNIKQGDFLGTTGNTGKSTGPHLHFETIRYGKKLDPLNFLIVKP